MHTFKNIIFVHVYFGDIVLMSGLISVSRCHGDAVELSCQVMETSHKQNATVPRAEPSGVRGGGGGGLLSGCELGVTPPCMRNLKWHHFRMRASNVSCGVRKVSVTMTTQLLSVRFVLNKLDWKHKRKATGNSDNHTVCMYMYIYTCINIKIYTCIYIIFMNILFIYICIYLICIHIIYIYIFTSVNWAVLSPVYLVHSWIDVLILHFTFSFKPLNP